MVLLGLRRKNIMTLVLKLTIAELRKLKRALEGDINCRNSTPIHDLHLHVAHVLAEHDNLRLQRRKTKP